MVTLEEIAKLAGVSKTTVSRILNKDETLKITPEVKDKVFSISHKLDYVPMNQRKCQSKKGITIGIADWRIVKKGNDNVSINDYAGVARRFCVVPTNFIRVSYNVDVEVDGIIALGDFNDSEIEFLKRQCSHIIFITSGDYNYDNDYIAMNYSIGMKNLCAYIFNTKKYESFGYIGGVVEDGAIKIGYHRAENIKNNLIEIEKFEEKYFCISNEISELSGYQMAQKLIDGGNIPQAILVGNEDLVVGVEKAFEEKKLTSNIEIIVYKDIGMLMTDFSRHTCLVCFPDFMWETAIKMLLERIEGKRFYAMTVLMPSIIKSKQN